MSALPLLTPLRHVTTDVLEVAYYETGSDDGDTVVLLHGFPYDIHSYVDVAPLLAESGFHVVVPHLRGHGPTRFLSDSLPGPVSRRHWEPTSSGSSTPSASSGPSSPATTGAGARPRSPRRCGPSASSGWSPSTVT